MVGVLSMMIGGMTVLAIPGIVLGLIGGDVRGSFVGATGAYLACLTSKSVGASPIDPPLIGAMVIYGALLGATALLFARFIVWKYGVIFRILCWAFPSLPNCLPAGNRSDTIAMWRGGPDKGGASTTIRFHAR
jgi:hypothetical protein